MVDFNKTIFGYFDQQVRTASFDSQLPPPREKDELRPSRPPRGVRTPSVGVAALRIPKQDPLPTEARGWTRRAGRLIAALEDALAQSKEDPSQIAAIERAWFAFEMGGSSDAEIAKIAHLCERAHAALQGKMNGPIQPAYLACAQVLYAGLPSSRKKGISEHDVLEVVKEMRRTVDAWTAVVAATSRILGWQIRWHEHAAQAVRTALEASSRT